MESIGKEAFGGNSERIARAFFLLTCSWLACVSSNIRLSKHNYNPLFPHEHHLSTVPFILLVTVIPTGLPETGKTTC
jgi:hypothetical protein